MLPPSRDQKYLDIKIFSLILMEIFSKPNITKDSEDNKSQLVGDFHKHSRCLLTQIWQHSRKLQKQSPLMTTIIQLPLLQKQQRACFVPV